MGDLPHDGYKEFVCLEAAQVYPKVQLDNQDKREWVGVMTIVAPFRDESGSEDAEDAGGSARALESTQTSSAL
tara:strand:- start:547 stop:765 length:219 start_codon:yes stop_codon:yes gene_type:complete